MQHRGTWLGIAISCCLMVSPWARADTFALKTGEQLEGTVVRAIGNAVTIRLDNRGMYQCPLSNLEWVSLIGRDGIVLQGTLEAWSEGTYILKTDQGVVSIKDGQIVKKGGQVIKEAVLSKPPVKTKPPKPAVTQQHKPVM